ncbi:Chromosome segregation ATPase [Lachnospiraceae bacterium NE2001]|nr:Chromosome segregation ATPase [Lachnospiraceae bacterium NE2001]
MPSINRIRVNNVKYNFGTQGYDDFSMRMYGRNTLYDLANGGGKSVLMLLLMQNLIPNCTLDDKQPIEKLFRDPSNTVIHSLIEWKLDACDIKEGMRYMTTGFAARKAATMETEGEEDSSQTAQIEYFNYVIFYRDYNKNDIINLPLVKDNEHISYKALRNYLHDLSRNDKNILVYVFDRKGEYQRFIADYGLYESHWEIIRGINRTEGHVRTYFESNYKTTRRVIEDLLIEEIIEKAYMTKTERETGKTENTVSLLMTIQDELKSLAEKKKGIQTYDHEQELVKLLVDRIDSFMSLYTQQEETAKAAGRILVTLNKEKEGREARLEELTSNVAEAEERLKATRELVEILKIYRDIEELEKRNELIQEKEAAEKKLASDIELQDQSYRYRLGVQSYLALKKAKGELDALANEKKDMPKGASDIYTVVANIRDRMDIILAQLEEKKKPVTESIASLKEELAGLAKEKAEAETEIAVLDSRIEYMTKDIESENSSLTSAQEDVDYALLMDPAGSIREETKQLNASEERTVSLRKSLEEMEFEKGEYQTRIEEVSDRLRELEIEEKSLEKKAEEYRGCKDKFKSLCSIYADDVKASPEEVEKRLTDRLSDTVINVYELGNILKKLEDREKDIREGKLIEESEGVKKVMDYLFTRQGRSSMHGMDYLAALPEAKREALLMKTPGIAFGVVVENLSEVLDDPGLMELGLNEEIYLYDRNLLSDASILLGDGVEAVRPAREFFIDAKYMDQKLRLLGADLDNRQEELRNSEIILETLREDLDFVKLFREKGLEYAEAEYAEAKEKTKSISKELSTLKDKLRALEDKIRDTDGNLLYTENAIKKYHTELISLNNVVSLQERISQLSAAKDRLKKEKKELLGRIENVVSATRTKELNLLTLNAELDNIEKESLELEHRWENKYGIYYMETTPFPRLDMDEAELERAFEVALGGVSDSRMAMEKEKLLQDTLAETIEREMKTIEKLGVELSLLEETDRKQGLTAASEEVLEAMRLELERLQKDRLSIEKELTQINTEKARVEGSIEYARERLGQEYGESALIRLSETKDIQDSQKALDDTILMSKQQRAQLDKVKAELKTAEGQARGNDDLIRLATRIVDANAIDISDLTPLDSADDLDDKFDGYITRYDRLSKDIDRAKADMLKVKMSVFETLSNMGVNELAMSIRNDVVIPENKVEAEKLLSRLGDVISIISLERDRVEKTLVSMQQLKDSFVDQCVERCLDVRSELDKLTKLSEISMGDTKVQMIRLTIPYVKDEFIKDRMSDYIDQIVEEVDKKETDAERQRFLGSSLAMKKLFSVIVTDMSKVRLLLYKRERIKEQSRYLRYEEAVGSTGQSQGIYIQFLISIINYIAGMYAVADSTTRSKTLFIDNPFGAAKDIYIWEPIFTLLAENSCQLIVPARGATPEITGRFDINYVLGQQMTGDRTTTVVVNYSSKTKGEELEYKDLHYQQQTFDFI